MKRACVAAMTALAVSMNVHATTVTVLDLNFEQFLFASPSASSYVSGSTMLAQLPPNTDAFPSATISVRPKESWINIPYVTNGVQFNESFDGFFGSNFLALGNSASYWLDGLQPNAQTSSFGLRFQIANWSDVQAIRIGYDWAFDTVMQAGNSDLLDVGFAGYIGNGVEVQAVQGATKDTGTRGSLLRELTAADLAGVENGLVFYLRFRLDPASGGAAVGLDNIRVEAVYADRTSVPEPDTMLLADAALFGLATLRRRPRSDLRELGCGRGHTASAMGGEPTRPALAGLRTQQTNMFLRLLESPGRCWRPHPRRSIAYSDRRVHPCRD